MPKYPVCVWVNGRCPVCGVRACHATKAAGNPCRPNRFLKRKTPTKRLRKPLPEED